VVINGMGMMGMGMMGMGMMGMGMMRDVYSPVMVKLEVVAANAFLALADSIDGDSIDFSGLQWVSCRNWKILCRPALSWKRIASGLSMTSSGG
jgi:hypothetical protein